MALVELDGKHVVVTGAARGIGAALARRFHQAGARVVVADREGLSAILDELAGSVGVTADIGTEAGNIDLIRAAEDAFGPIDLFFANAGVGTGGDPMTPDDAWNTAFDINVHAHRWAARHLLPGWLARGEGYFCSTASAAGLLAQIGSAPYSLTKHAAVAFAEWMSITYGDQGIRVSCLCPQGRQHGDAERQRRRRARGVGGISAATSCGSPASCSNPTTWPPSSTRRSGPSDSSSSPTRRSPSTCDARPPTPTAGWPACASCSAGCSVTERVDARR